MNLKTFDLNLLPVLDALLSEQSVTRAAQRLHLSQPAVSNALARLRRQSGDAILVRGASGLMPTPRAAAMAASVRQILEAIESTLTPATFDPQRHEQTFQLMMSDYVALLLLPELIAELSQAAPGVTVSVCSLSPTQASEALLKGTLDLAFGDLGEIAQQLYRKPLLAERFVCLARQDHPRIQGSLSLAQFLAEGHILVSPHGGGFVGLVDTLLAEQGLVRRVVLSIPHFMVAPDIIIGSDLLITLPLSSAQKFVRHFPLQVLAAPLELPPYAISQAWHARTHNEPSQRWLRGLLTDLANKIQAQRG